MSYIRIIDGFSGVEQENIPCADGQGTMRVYPLFDGVKALKILDTNQVLELGNDAICVLDELTDLTLGAATSALGGGAVELCPKLQNIRLYSTMIPEWAGSRDPFSTSVMENVNLYVPDVAVPDYKQNMLWSNFVNILPMSQAPEIDVPGVEPTGVENVTATESAPIILQGNRAICEGADEIAAFDRAGRLVTRTDGDTLILAPGTYIVRAGAAVAKVIIR